VDWERKDQEKKIETEKIKFLHRLRDINYVNKGKGKGKVIPLQARCGPENG